MKIDFSQELGNTFDDKPIIFTNNKPATLRDIACDSLASIHEDERNNPPDGKQKLERYQLGMKILSATTDTEFTGDEYELLKKIVGKHPSPLIVGKCWILLEAAHGAKAAE